MRRRKSAADKRKSLAAKVTRTLRTAAIDAVLVGGSVVSLYSSERYVTDDLDFVSYKPLCTIAPVMEAHGWKMIVNRATPPATELYVQFCAPPLAVGREPVEAVKLKVGSTTIETLSPTDCVLDRLTKYFHWNDEQGLAQAVLVAQHRQIDFDKVRAVYSREGKLDQFRVFETRLHSVDPKRH